MERSSELSKDARDVPQCNQALLEEEDEKMYVSGIMGRYLKLVGDSISASAAVRSVAPSSGKHTLMKGTALSQEKCNVRNRDVPLFQRHDAMSRNLDRCIRSTMT